MSLNIDQFDRTPIRERLLSNLSFLTDIQCQQLQIVYLMDTCFVVYKSPRSDQWKILMNPPQVPSSFNLYTPFPHTFIPTILDSHEDLIVKATELQADGYVHYNRPETKNKGSRATLAAMFDKTTKLVEKKLEKAPLSGMPSSFPLPHPTLAPPSPIYSPSNSSPLVPHNLPWFG